MKNKSIPFVPLCNQSSSVTEIVILKVALLRPKFAVRLNSWSICLSSEFLGFNVYSTSLLDLLPPNFDVTLTDVHDRFYYACLWVLFWYRYTMEIAEHPAFKNLINQTPRGRYLGPDSNVCDSHLIEVNQGSPIESYFDQLRNTIPQVIFQ